MAGDEMSALDRETAWQIAQSAPQFGPESDLAARAWDGRGISAADLAPPSGEELPDAYQSALQGQEPGADADSGGVVGFYGWHAERGHAPQYTPEGGAECKSCGESMTPIAEREAEAG